VLAQRACVWGVDIEMPGWATPRCKVPETDGRVYVLIQMGSIRRSVQELAIARQPLPCGLGRMLADTNDVR
jgi:hypothetical protein